MGKDLRERIIEIFRRLYEFHSTLGRRGNLATRFRVASYAKILRKLEKWDRPIYSSADLTGESDIGKSTLEKIDLIAKSGTHPLYEEVMKNKEYQILLSFQRVRGIGPERAYQIYQDGYHSLDKLRKDVLKGKYLVDKNMKAALLYFDDLEEPIPRREVKQITTDLQKMINHSEQIRPFTLLNSGSYRMGKAKSGDIDLLMIVPDGQREKRAKEIRKRLEEIGFIQHLYNASGKKINAIIQNPKNGKMRQMDILFIYRKEVPWYLLYFGSGKEFSKKIRWEAIQRGYKLNEKGLFSLKSGKRIPFQPSEEREIFDFLKIPYVPPNKR